MWRRESSRCAGQVIGRQPLKREGRREEGSGQDQQSGHAARRNAGEERSRGLGSLHRRRKRAGISRKSVAFQSSARKKCAPDLMQASGDEAQTRRRPAVSAVAGAPRLITAARAQEGSAYRPEEPRLGRGQEKLRSLCVGLGGAWATIFERGITVRVKMLI
ncbi:hypothetical protein MTO96_013303 [Rhipicephalus appendiculatus]